MVDAASLFAGLPPEAQSAIALGISVSPDLQVALAKGQAIAGDVAPALALIDLFAAGGSPAPMQVVGAMAGALGTINPAAGAVVMAMGSLVAGITEGVNDVFRAVGLQHETPRPKLVVGGMGIGVDNIPHPPDVDGNYDSLWRHWSDLVQPRDYGMAHGIPEYAKPVSYLGSPHAPGDWVMLGIVSRLAGARTWGSNYHPAALPTPGAEAFGRTDRDFSTPANAFEKAFFAVLKTDVEYWFNGQAYVPPRTLLKAFAKAWNLSHEPAGAPAKPGSFAGMIAGVVTSQISVFSRVVGDVTYVPRESESYSLPELLLSGVADTGPASQRDSALTIHMGPRIVAKLPPKLVVPLRLAAAPAPARQAPAPAAAAPHVAAPVAAAAHATAAPAASAPAVGSGRLFLELGALAVGVGAALVFALRRK